MRRSRTSGAAAGLLATAIAATAVSAHRLDEYLQAARVGIDPGRVVVDVDLTPGVAVAAAVLDAVDADRDGAVSTVEGRAYLATALAALSVAVDGMPLTLAPGEAEFPSPDAVRQGVGTARLRASAPLPPLAPGPHRLEFRNGHQPEISAYLANALVPADDRIAITGQWRDATQQVLQIDFTVQGGSGALLRTLSLGGFAGLVALGAAARRRRSRRRVPTGSPN